MTALHAGNEARLAAVVDALEAVGAAEKKEVAALKDQWAIEDVDRAKGKKGKAPAKEAKKSSVSGAKDAAQPGAAPPGEPDIEADREAELAALRQAEAALLAAVANSKSGVATLSALVQKLRRTAALPALASSRGMALAARDLSDGEALPAYAADTVAYCSGYGAGDGPFGHSLIPFQGSPQATVMHMLLALDDPRRRARAAMLDKKMRVAGSAWRRVPGGGSTVGLVLAGHFSEFSAIQERGHLPLQDIRRALPMARDVTASSMVLSLNTDLDISVVSPVAQPALCGNQFTAALRCAPTLHVTAVVEPDAPGGSAAKPVIVNGEALVQRRSDGLLGVTVVLPAKGAYRVVLFAKDDAGDDTYRRIGAIAVVATPQLFDLAQSWRRLPTVSGDFNERQCRLVAPLDGLLVPDTEYTFHVAVPVTNYKASERLRIESSLAAATAQSEGSQAAIQRLQDAVDEAAAARDAQQAAHAEQLPALQADIAGAVKDNAKKKGKDLERGRVLVVEAEEKIAVLEADVAAAKVAVAEAEQRLVTHRRSARQATAMRARCLRDQQQLHEVTDRSQPLHVDLSVDERRAVLQPCVQDMTEYKCVLRVPARGRICVFIAGVTAVTFDIVDKADI
jgi:hypothetical protein